MRQPTGPKPPRHKRRMAGVRSNAYLWHLQQRRRLLRSGEIWTPAALFAQGQQGVWYEPKPEYLFQDSAGTTPVTADGDPVGYMEDLSGNGNHATQDTAGFKPLYRTDGVLHWLELDGVDDHLDVSGGNALRDSSLSLFAALSVVSASVRASIYSSGDVNAFSSVNISTEIVNGDFGLFPRTPTSFQVIETLSSGLKYVSSVRADGQTVSGRVNQGETSSRASTLGSDNANGPFIGCSLNKTEKDFFISGNLYGIIKVMVHVDDSSRNDTEGYLGKLAGVTL